jgi:hypothetical protein
MFYYNTPKATMQQLLQKHPAALEKRYNAHVQKVLHRLSLCRTA